VVFGVAGGWGGVGEGERDEEFPAQFVFQPLGGRRLAGFIFLNHAEQVRHLLTVRGRTQRRTGHEDGK
jgi:hypothetical protein